jgi:hypothetical protein
MNNHKENVMSNSIRIGANGYLNRPKAGAPKLKLFDSTASTQNASTTATLVPLSGPAQGTAVNQRTGDTVRLCDRLVLNYTTSSQNADVFNTVRVIVFQWIPNTALTVPTAASILQNANNILSPYDFQNSNQYRILYDAVHLMSGTAAGPTSAGNQGFYGELSLSRALKLLEFATGAVTGSNQLYLMFLSDSALLPFPLMNYWVRVFFYDQ